MAYNLVRIFNKGRFIGHLGDLNFDEDVNVSNVGGQTKIEGTSGNVVTQTIYLGNNKVHSAVPPVDGGLLLISTKFISKAYTDLIRYDVGSSPAAEQILHGNSVDVATGVLDGNDGHGGKITVSAAGDGCIYIQNRTGAARYIQLTFFG